MKKKKFLKTALLISTYNWSEALELVLKSVACQTVKPDELLVADDGSGEDTKKIIDAFAKRVDFPVLHIWHEDKGFRKSIILNKAIARMQADYVIQVDGDCILHPNFIADHKRFAQKQTYLYGSRVNIKREFLPTLFKLKKTRFNFFSRGIKKRSRTIYVPILTALYKSTNELSKKLRGCNVSYWRSDIIAVNGYNEDITGWGREDSEVILRMINNGVKGKRIRYAGIVYHIWHKTLSKSKLKENDTIQKQVINQKINWCKKGIDNHL